MRLDQLTIGELEAWLRGLTWQQVEEILPRLQEDPRRGVKDLGRRWLAKIEKKRKKMHRWQDLCRREGELRAKGYRYVAGIDEAGRGPLAGPVVAAAVILPVDKPLLGLDDSKKLTSRQRQELYREITKAALAWSVGYSSPQYIDATDILQATRRAMEKALEKLPVRPDYLLVDALHLPDVDLPQEAVNWHKQRRLSRLAQFYLVSRGLAGVNCRFDVVAVLLSEGGKPQVEIIKDAFPLQGG